MKLAVCSSAILLLLLGFAWGQDKEFTETVSFEPGQSLSLKNYKGSIHISSWDRPEVSILARIAPPEGEPAEYADRVVEATRIDVRKRGDRLEVFTNSDDVPARKSGWFSESKNLAFVHYELRVPRQLALSVEDYKSRIEIYELAGLMELETYKGEVTVGDFDGEIRLETYKGIVELEGVRGSLDLETYKGSISARVIELTDSSKVDTYKGVVEIALNPTQALSLKGEPGKGSIEGDFLADHLQRVDKKHIRAEVNAGGPVFDVSTYKGKVRFVRW